MNFSKYLLAVAICLSSIASAKAHFIWLLTNREKVEVFFGEDASPDDPELLKRVADIQMLQLMSDSTTKKLKPLLKTESLTAKLNDPMPGAIVLAKKDFGVFDRGEKKFRLMYYAKTGPNADHETWESAKSSKHADFDIVPVVSDNQVTLKVYFQGKPVADAEIIGHGPIGFDLETTSDSKGLAKFAINKTGLYSFRARHIEAVPGELDGKAYPETRHYATLTLHINSVVPTSTEHTVPNLPLTLTSFGAATIGQDIYVYGGHNGSAHSYSKAEQNNRLLKFDSKQKKWMDLPAGPKLQGLAMVTDGKKLYRLGGFTAKNDVGEDQDLWSQDSAAMFDPQTSKWSELPKLPEPRSSFDAAVLDGTIYIIGGWQMSGDADSIWHQTAWKLDLNKKPYGWEKIANPGFKRRAISVAAHKGKIYSIGGMKDNGNPTLKVSVYDVKENSWSEGPDLLGDKTLNGFGSSAFAVDGKLYVSTMDGSLQQLSPDGTKWLQIGKLPHSRFFHRMVPFGPKELVFVGGANMGTGKFEEVDVVNANQLESE